MMKILGRNNSTPLKYIIHNNIKSTNKTEISNILAETFKLNPFSKKANCTFKNFSKKEEKK